ncbi:TolB family protein [Tepidibacter mesophilus]|uniref:TolB family protein n=1 Tax=Tepidibacter mesophilus TaxID=655607 RepID=UPI000C06A121|nr:PD40 domain-containing protein [Tepidibacter mesophilus]
MKKYFFVLFFIICIIFILTLPTMSASNDFVGLDNNIDISPNDDRIVFSYYQKGVASIYTSKINGSNVVQVTKDKKNSHLCPVYSPDGSKIIFISTPKNKTTLKSSIWIMNKDGSNKKEILKADGFINKAVFSPNQEHIYFSKAGNYKNYSPIARKTFHDFDLYSIDIDGKNLNQLTSEKSYNISDLGITSNGNALIFEKNNNIHFFYLDSSKKVDIIKPLENYSNIEQKEVYDPALSPDNKFVAFSAVANQTGTFEYELFTMNMETKECKHITNLKSCVSKPVYFHKSNKILFSQDMNWPNNPSKYKICILDTNSNNIENVDITINSK